MTSTNGSSPLDSQAALEADIQRQRDQLAETVDALHARLDVKTRSKAKVRELTDRARDQARELADRATTDDGRPTPPVLAAAAAALLLVGVLVWRRTR